MKNKINPDFWGGKKVLITGHTGFKGSWLSLWLQKLGASVRGISLEPEFDPAMFYVANVGDEMEHCVADIRDLSAIKNHVIEFSPDVLFHMAAQPLVRKSYKSPVETFETNVMGTVNVLEACRSSKDLVAIVNVTTDKCYENREWLWGYREDEPMGGQDPYSSSKGCVELLSAAYRKSFFADCGISMATARAGNVIGGGDWSPDRLLPDIFRSLENGLPVKVRNPGAIRPWQHVLEPLAGYLLLAECLYSKGGASFSEGWNFGPRDEDSRSVEWVVGQVCNFWLGDASWIKQDGEHPHEANILKLDISKAQQRLKWSPIWDLQTALAKTIFWHRSWRDGVDMKEVTYQQIESYLKPDCAQEEGHPSKKGKKIDV